jgi:HEAT repeat protein
MNRHCAVGLLLVLILFAVLFAIAFRKPQPVYAGRPVREWLDCGYEQAALALEETGPIAAPVIFSKLRREHPEYGLRAKYQRIWCKAPRIIRSWLPTPKAASFDEARACSALLEIGPAVTPVLTSGLRDTNPAVRIASASALARLRQRGCNINLAIPSLRRAEEDPHPQVRRWAGLALKGWTKS